jgi:hypothetical protein
MEETEQVAWFINQMKSQGVKWLDGVPGHTLYLVLRLGHKDDLPNPNVEAALKYSDVDPVTSQFGSEVRRSMEDWLRIQKLEHKQRIEKRERALALREAALIQRESVINQRETQYHAHPLVRFYHWLRKIVRDV